MPTTPLDTIRTFYAALAAGDASSALGLMSSDIEWTAMWPYRPDGRGPEKVVQGVFVPLQQDWQEFKIVPSEYAVEGKTVLSIGRFTGTHRASGKYVDAAYAHVWTVSEGQIVRFRQYIDTLAIAEGPQHQFAKVRSPLQALILKRKST